MLRQDIENWMLATDAEREQLLAGWDVDAGDGRDIADAVAKLFQKECVYTIDEVSIILDEGMWKILALASDDYDSLKNRYMEFLGFNIMIGRSG